MANKINKSKLPLDAFLRTDESSNSLTISIDGEDTLWEYKDLSWWEKNKCISKATLMLPNDKGETTFSFDLAVYYAEALQTMITGAPFPITTTTLQNLKSEIGERLVAIIPLPMDGVQVEVKKD